ncbi:hypothetical protein HDU82_002783 [Entophlyctis luteolus]|nr:hypothetical protein HDU82_002783 [Entophlyctis luteolus]
MMSSQLLSVPPEIAGDIIAHLPIDAAVLMEVGLASRNLFARQIFRDAASARRHLRAQLRIHYATLGPPTGTVVDASSSPFPPPVAREDGIWGFLHLRGLVHEGYRKLPLPYQIAIYGELMQHDDWIHVGGVADGALNLMAYSQWILPERRALRVVQSICKYSPPSSYTPNAQMSRVFRWAARSGHLMVVKWLLENCPLVDPAADDNYAIKTAAEANHIEVVRFLLKDPRCDPAAEENCALEYACENGLTDVVKLLLADARTSPGMNGNHCFIFACRGGFIEIVRILMADPRVDVAYDNNFGLEWACKYGHADVAKLLLSDSRIILENDATFFFSPCENGHRDVVEVLLAEPRITPDNLALQLACENGHTDVVALLLADRRADPGDEENLPIRVAAQNGHTSVLKLLLEDTRCDPASTSNEALYLACENGHAEAVKLLLGDPRCSPLGVEDGLDLMRICVASNNSDVFEMLLADGRIDPLANDMTTLWDVWNTGQVQLMRRLLVDGRVFEGGPGSERVWVQASDDDVRTMFESVLRKRITC